MLFTAKRDVIIAEWPACDPTAHVVAESLRNIGKGIQVFGPYIDLLIRPFRKHLSVPTYVCFLHYCNIL